MLDNEDFQSEILIFQFDGASSNSKIIATMLFKYSYYSKTIPALVSSNLAETIILVCLEYFFHLAKLDFGIQNEVNLMKNDM